MANLLSYTLKLQDLMSPALRKVASVGESSIGRISKAVQGVQGKVGNMGSAVAAATSKIAGGSSKAVVSLTSLEIKLNTLTKERALSVNIRDIMRANRAIEDTERKMEHLQNVGKRGGGGGGMGLGMGLLGGLAVGAGASGLSSIVEATAEYQKFQAVLTNSLGSQDLANSAMGMLQDFAQKTPFALSELTGSYVALINQGFKPTQNQLTSLGDLAASVGKPFAQLSEALIDAKTGEMERLKEFGITASKIKGVNAAEMTFKGQTTTVALTGQAMSKYLDTLGKLPGVQGTMASVSKTLGGQLSNLGDKYDQLKIKAGTALMPIMTRVIDLTSRLMDKVDRFTNFIQKHSTAFSILGGVIATVGAGVLAYNGYVSIAAIATKGWAVATALYETVTLAAATATGGWATAWAVLNGVMALNPIGLIVAGVVALTAAVLYAWNNFEGFRGAVFAVWESTKFVFNSIGALAKAVFTNVAILANPVNWMNPTLMKVAAGNVMGEMRKFSEGLGKAGAAGYSRGVKNFQQGNKSASPDEQTSGGTSPAAAGGGVGLSNAKGKSGGGATGAGRGVTNITINVHQLVGQSTVHVTQLREGVDAVKSQVQQALMSVLNDANAMTTQG